MVFSKKLDSLDRLSGSDAIKQLANHIRVMQEELEYRLMVLDSSNIAEIDLGETNVMTTDGNSLHKVLSDASGKVVARTKKMTLARVPYMTDRGTFIRNGHEYCFSNIMRLEPGVYVKERPDEVSAQFNIKQGTGGGFGMRMVPRTGVFEMTRGTGKAPAYTVLKDMGVTDDQMKAAWGDALYSINRDAGMSTRARQQADRFYN